MCEYLPDDYWIFDAGNDLYLTTTLITGFYVYIENPLQSLCPGHGCPLLEQTLIL